MKTRRLRYVGEPRGASSATPAASRPGRWSPRSKTRSPRSGTRPWRACADWRRTKNDSTPGSLACARHRRASLDEPTARRDRAGRRHHAPRRGPAVLSQGGDQGGRGRSQAPPALLGHGDDCAGPRGLQRRHAGDDRARRHESRGDRGVPARAGGPSRATERLSRDLRPARLRLDAHLASDHAGQEMAGADALLRREPLRPDRGHLREPRHAPEPALPRRVDHLRGSKDPRAASRRIPPAAGCATSTSDPTPTNPAACAS